MAKDGKDGALTPTTRRLVDAAAEIMGEPALTDRDRAFMARQLMQATLPPGSGDVPPGSGDVFCLDQKRASTCCGAWLLWWGSRSSQARCRLTRPRRA
jgi:hypothetical protein